MPTLSRTINNKLKTGNKYTLKGLLFIHRKALLNVSSLKLSPGFSLVEILVSMVIVVLLGFMLLTASGSLTQTHSSNLQTIASKIASKEIETLRETSFSSLPPSGSISDPYLSKLPSGVATRTITNYLGDPDIKQVLITVTWVFNNNTRQFQMITLIYENGI